MRKTEDTYRHKGLRKKLVDGIRNKGITDENVLRAISNIPRHFFLDSAFDEVAYEDKAFPIAEGQTISQPYTVAYQSQLLEIKPFEKVLEIGTGSAYQARCLKSARPMTKQLKNLNSISISFLKMQIFPARIISSLVK